MQIKKDTTDLGNTKSLEEQLKELRNKDLGEGIFKVTKLITDTGFNTFGPFIFYVNNKVIQSDTIKLHFDNPLPSETRGIWIRQLSYNVQEYLIIEQRISGEWVTTKTSNNSTSMEFKKDSNDFLEIDKEKVDNNKIKFEFSFSTSKSQEVEINNKSETVNYKISLYKIKRTGGFKSTYKLNKRNLKFLPNNQNDFEFIVK